MTSPHPLPWDVLLIGGPAGVGKSRLSRRLAQHFDVDLTAVDDLHLAVSALTTPAQQPVLHYWATNPDALYMTAEESLELHRCVARVLRPALEAVIADHLEERVPVILEGDYLLPELLKEDSLDTSRIKAVFVIEPDAGQIVKNLLAREPAEGEQTSRAHVSWQFGEWLQAECERYGVPAFPARPWETGLERVLKTLGGNASTKAG